MKINYHICFSKEKAPELIDLLYRNDVPFQSSGHMLTTDISDTSPHWKTIRAIVESKQLTCLPETSFTKRELSNAEWLCVRSKWRNGYPQPESKFGYQTITYDSTQYCESCGSGLRQQSAFRFKSSPKWGNRHFMMVNWVNDELFVDRYVKGILETNRISGISFTQVHNKDGSAVLPDVFQLSVEEESPIGLLEEQASIQGVDNCIYCGCKKFHPSGIGKYAVQKAVFASMPDICKSAEILGWGKSAHRLIFVRHSVYRVITENNLDRGLVFSPVDLV
mgnify:CR=1 FL=1|jgi:hypothetical protein